MLLPCICAKRCMAHPNRCNCVGSGAGVAEWVDEAADADADAVVFITVLVLLLVLTHANLEAVHRANHRGLRVS